MLPHIFIATPMYGGQCTGLFMLSMLQAVKVFQDMDVNFTFRPLLNESLIQRGRNVLAHAFLKMDECTHLMFIDADIRFSAFDIVRMLRADKDVICGICPSKEINWPSVARAVKDGVPVDQLKAHTGIFVVNLVGDAAQAKVPVNEPMEIMNGGTGFMLIKRAVLEHMKTRVPTYRNDVTYLGDNLGGEEIAEFFPVMIDTDSKRLLSEDYGFCKICRDAGYKIHAAPWAKLGHYGTYLFEGQLIPVP